MEVADSSTQECHMEIEIGTQPNCSELIIRIGDYTEAEVKKELEKIGIKEYLIKDRYSFEKKEAPNWDGENNVPKVSLTKDLSPKVLKAWYTVDSSDEDKERYDNAIQVLKENGLDRWSDTIILCDETLISDTFGAEIWLGEYPDEPGTKAIWYHQHCQRQGFPSLQKIANHFGSSVEPYDGGSIEDYEAFLNGEDEVLDE